MLRSTMVALALLAGSALPAAAQWSFVGGDGEAVALDETPVRIIASQDAAAGLIPLGIRPVGIYADSAVADAKALQGLDLSGIEIIGQAWGEVDIEKAAALEPDLIIGEYWPLDKTWSGGDDVVAALSPLAPLTGPIQGDAILTLIEDYEALAQSLGADLSATEIAASKTEFETALSEFKAAVAAKPAVKEALMPWFHWGVCTAITPSGMGASAAPRTTTTRSQPPSRSACTAVRNRSPSWARTLGDPYRVPAPAASSTPTARSDTIAPFSVGWSLGCSHNVHVEYAPKFVRARLARIGVMADS